MSVFLCSVWVLSLFAWLKVGEDKGTQPVKRNILRQLKYPAPGSEQLELVHAISSPTRRQRVVRQVPIQLVPNPPDIPPPSWTEQFMRGCWTTAAAGGFSAAESHVLRSPARFCRSDWNNMTPGLHTAEECDTPRAVAGCEWARVTWAPRATVAPCTQARVKQLCYPWRAK